MNLMYLVASFLKILQRAFNRWTNKGNTRSCVHCMKKSAITSYVYKETDQKIKNNKSRFPILRKDYPAEWTAFLL